MNAVAINWSQFSTKYLAFNEENRITANALTTAFSKFVQDNQQLDLYPSVARILKKYAFKKANKGYGNGFNLSKKGAEKVFNTYIEKLNDTKVQIRTIQGFDKPPKPKLDGIVGGLAAISPSISIKILEPQQKERIQKIFNQIPLLNQKVISAVKGEEIDPNLDISKLLPLEIIAKKLAYLNPLPGERFQIPYEGRFVEYEVQPVHVWMHMTALGFKPVDPNEKAPPILAFSGTRLSLANPGSLDTLAADADPRGVGYIAFQFGRSSLREWLENAGGNAIVTGHSLGGALSRYTAIEFPDLVQGAYTFSAPGIYSKYKNKWKELKKSGRKIPVIYNFNHSEDRIPLFGQSNMGKNYQIICSVEKTVNQKLGMQRSIHSKMLFAKNVAVLCKTKVEKSMSNWKQTAIAIIPFIFLMVVACVMRVLFGVYTTNPYISVFGPFRWLWHKFVTDNIVENYLKNQKEIQAA